MNISLNKEIIPKLPIFNNKKQQQINVINEINSD